MLSAMKRMLLSLGRVLRWTGFGIVLVQILAMAGLTIRDVLTRKHRKLERFPYTPATTLDLGKDAVTVYTYGEEVYADMLSAIDAAQDYIYFETFIWKGDDVGHAFRDALGRAASRGVKVHVIWDDFANLVVPRRFFSAMPKGIVVMRHPAIAIPWLPTTWGRDHRKLLIVDGTTGFIGGYNIGDLYATGWRDTHARVQGPAAAELENAFVDFWNQHCRDRGVQAIPQAAKRRWFADLRVHRNTPRIQVYPIRNMYLEAIDRATDRIWLTHAYLIPDLDLVAALQAAVARGVDVRIIIPQRSNHVVADWMSRGFYTQLLRAGIKLHLYQAAMVHSKTAVIDGTWSTIGTANLDRLSLMGNYEVNLEIIDEDVAEHMEVVFERDLHNTIELTERRWAERSALTKFTERLLRPWRQLF